MQQGRFITVRCRSIGRVPIAATAAAIDGTSRRAQSNGRKYPFRVAREACDSLSFLGARPDLNGPERESRGPVSLRRASRPATHTFNGRFSGDVVNVRTYEPPGSITKRPAVTRSACVNFRESWEPDTSTCSRIDPRSVPARGFQRDDDKFHSTFTPRRFHRFGILPFIFPLVAVASARPLSPDSGYLIAPGRINGGFDG